MCHETCFPNPSQEDEALGALRILCQALTKPKLRMLNLSDNALGEKGVRACAEAITSQVRPGVVLWSMDCGALAF